MRNATKCIYIQPTKQTDGTSYSYLHASNTSSLLKKSKSAVERSENATQNKAGNTAERQQLKNN